MSLTRRTLDRQRRRRTRVIGALRRVVVLVRDVFPGFEDTPLMTACVTFKRAIGVSALDDVLDPNQADCRAAGTGGLVGHERNGSSSGARRVNAQPPFADELVKVGLARVVEDEMRMLRANLVEGSTP